jgi:murein DD-endopeptidase MepM/ murein hydrolase activator NlpD
MRSGRLFLCALVTIGAGCAQAPSVSAPVRTSQDVALPLDTATIEGRVPRAATLEALLRQNAVDPGLTASVTDAVRSVFNPRNLQADRSFKLTRTLDGLVREFRYEIDASKFLRVVFRERRSDGQPQYDAAVVSYPREVSVDAVTANVSREHPSIVAAFDAAGESVQLPMALAEIFSGEVDFNTEVQRGDTATVLFERVRRDGEPVGYGDVQAAIFEHGGKRMVGINYPGPDGKAAWYDEHGRSLTRQFLKSPLPFEPRVTSGYTAHRVHPIFGDVRAHLGIDYAAPSGTPVVAIASGTVESADWAGDAGRLVVVRHADGYETMYMHLSSFGPGIHAGVHVSQGQLLGRVGMTGAATGPHLDFRVKKNGVHMNPVLLHNRMPAGEPLTPDTMPAFSLVRDKALGQLKTLSAKSAN